MAALWFEDCKEGLTIEHAIRRTITEADNVLFSVMTLNVAPLHLDAEYSKNSIFGQRLVNSLFLLGFVCGVTVPDTTLGTTLGNLGFEKITFPNPVFHGDTIHVRTEIVAARVSKSRSEIGRASCRERGEN